MPYRRTRLSAAPPRSFKQGKKVTVSRDPLTWIRAMLRLRFTRVDPLAVVERERQRERERERRRQQREPNHARQDGQP